ncbi:Asp23/Gls24 family envelope stress response protein [Lactococcus insecticola]|uniref:Alkaline-shock protein n=1 Tax=Pseudolactococcus insecticola TaxID=2709158 RepID=A0A6A0B3G8_9LACT|nr:Asp23/Gls24 family envelope stress response protein [Lactococcus insecticola]GFH39626.1 hypothetical protein Hs20B_00240 [Lactococcus insecticola]
MTDTITQEETLGEIVIAPQVVETIVAIAAAKVDGVYSLRNKRFADRIGKKADGRGVYVRQEDDKVAVDIYVYLTYGVSVPSVAMAMQSAVKDSVKDMSDIAIDEVNIHVAGVVPEKTPKPDFKELFDEDFLDVD